ncbi:MAG: hypothetical protein H7124_09955 [Phycisphaerales bacterium]|nr:hypothetical protein [Hyphomonadaceae bacterium]
MTNAPADKTAKRISAEDWFARYDSVDLLKSRAEPTEAPRMRPPADRIAVRG